MQCYWRVTWLGAVHSLRKRQEDRRRAIEEEEKRQQELAEAPRARGSKKDDPTLHRRF